MRIRARWSDHVRPGWIYFILALLSVMPAQAGIHGRRRHKSWTPDQVGGDKCCLPARGCKSFVIPAQAGIYGSRRHKSWTPDRVGGDKCCLPVGGCISFVIPAQAGIHLGRRHEPLMKFGVTQPSPRSHPLKQPTRQAANVPHEFQFQQLCLELCGAPAATGLQRVQAHRVVAHGPQ